MKRAVYVIDASSLIRARESYPFNHFGDLWEQLELLIKHGRLRAPEQVREELDSGQDDLKKWARSQKPLFAPTDEALQNALRQIGERLPAFIAPPGRTKNYADPWVVALALQLGAAVITEEKGKGLGPGAVKVPDACKHFGLHHSRFQGLFAAENWTFRLER